MVRGRDERLRSASERCPAWPDDGVHVWVLLLIVQELDRCRKLGSRTRLLEVKPEAGATATVRAAAPARTTAAAADAAIVRVDRADGVVRARRIERFCPTLTPRFARRRQNRGSAPGPTSSWTVRSPARSLSP